MSLKSVGAQLRDRTDVVEVEDAVSIDVLAKTQQVLIETGAAELNILRSIEEVLFQLADNVYNIAGKIGAQITSLQTVRDHLHMDRDMAAKEASQDELAAIEEDREDIPAREPKEPEERVSYLEKFFKKLYGVLRVFTALLVPMAVGAWLQMREWFEGNFGEIGEDLFTIGSIITGVLLVFRKKVVGAFKFMISAAGGIVRGVAKFAPWLLKAGGVLAKIVGKLALPITILVGLYDAVTNAIEGYEKGGIVSAIREGLAGLTAGLIGWIGDLGGWIIGSLASLFGFEEIGEVIKGFDVTQFVHNTVGQLFDVVSGFLGSWVDSLSQAFDALKSGNTVGALMALISSPFKGLYEGLSNALKIDPATMMRDTFLSIAPPGSLLDWVIPDQVYKTLGVDPETGQPLPTLPKTGMKEIARELFLKYAPVDGVLDWVIPDAVYRSIGINPSTGAIIQDIQDMPETITQEQALQMISTSTESRDSRSFEPVFVDPRPAATDRNKASKEGGVYVQSPLSTATSSQISSVLSSESFIESQLLDRPAIAPTTLLAPRDGSIMAGSASPTVALSSRMMATTENNNTLRETAMPGKTTAGTMTNISAPVITSSVNNQTAVMGPLMAVGNQFGVGLF